MDIQTLVQKKQDELAEMWINAVFSTYPDKSAAVLRTNADPFTNPVGSMVRDAANCLINALALENVTVESVKNALDRFIKIRAVQNLTPSQAIGVIYLLKPIVRNQILPDISASSIQDYLELESRIDTLALLAFDMYMQDKETVAQIRVREIRNQYAQLKRWAQKLNDTAPLGTFVGCGN